MLQTQSKIGARKKEQFEFVLIRLIYCSALPTHLGPRRPLLTEQLFLPPCGLDLCNCGNKHKSAAAAEG